MRVLVTRYWPRGFKKDSVSLWLKDIGPAPSLIKKWKSGSMRWEEFRALYLEEFADAQKLAVLALLKEQIASSDAPAVTLLCACREDEAHCHRAVLKDILDGRIKL